MAEEFAADAAADATEEALRGAAPFANLPGGTEGWLYAVVVFAAKEPWQFLWYVLLCLSPLFCLSAMLSWRLAQEIDSREKDKAKKNKKRANLNKVNKNK